MPSSLSFDASAAAISLIGVIATFAVCRWRIGDLERRVQQLEQSERNHSDRVVVIETKLTAIETILQRIADKLDVS
jgi:hypothetical protein